MLCLMNCFAHDAGFAAAANHAQESEGETNPLGQHQRVVLVPTRDHEPEGWRGRWRNF